MIYDGLSQTEFFKIINNNKYVFEIEHELEKYVPDFLYKFLPFPKQKYKKKERMRQLKNGEIWFSAKSSLNDPFELEHIILNKASPEAQGYYKGKQPDLEFFCLTATPTNKLMWSHYANSYKGFCLEYRVQNKCCLYPVIYDNTLPDMSEYYQRFYDNRDDLSFSSLGNKEVDKDILRLNYPLSSKDECWAYEQEFRIIRSIKPGESQSAGHIRKSKDYGLYLSSVIIGTYCSDEDAELIITTVRQINAQRYRNKKNLILSSPNCNRKCRENIDKLVREFSKNDPVYSPVTVKRLKWDNKLQLTTEECIGE